MMSEREWLDIFGDNLQAIMSDMGYTQEDLADSIGASQTAISFYINKVHVPNLKNILNMSYELGISPDELINFFGEMIE